MSISLIAIKLKGLAAPGEALKNKLMLSSPAGLLASSYQVFCGAPRRCLSTADILSRSSLDSAIVKNSEAPALIAKPSSGL